MRYEALGLRTSWGTAGRMGTCTSVLAPSEMTTLPMWRPLRM